MYEFYYEKKHGSFHYYTKYENCEPQLQFHTPEVAIAFDKRDFVLHKHGRKESVAKWAEEARAKYTEAGLDEIAQDIVVISSDKWKVEDLQRIINSSGYMRFWLKDNACKICNATILEDCDAGLHG